jgi:hypothetical protein
MDHNSVALLALSESLLRDIYLPARAEHGPIENFKAIRDSGY